MSDETHVSAEALRKMVETDETPATERLTELFAQRNARLRERIDELEHEVRASHPCSEFEALEIDNAGLRDVIARVRQIATDESLQSDEGILIIDPSRITDIINEGLADSDG